MFLSVECKMFLIFKCYMKAHTLYLCTDLGETINSRHLRGVFQDTVATEVKKLLALKADFKSATGIDWKPGVSAPSTTGSAPNVEILSARNAQQGNRVKELKAQNASKVTSRTN
jgi:bifunctional glutamyl/prolyl-tRNA synthetase